MRHGSPSSSHTGHTYTCLISYYRWSDYLKCFSSGIYIRILGWYGEARSANFSFSSFTVYDLVHSHGTRRSSSTCRVGISCNFRRRSVKCRCLKMVGNSGAVSIFSPCVEHVLGPKFYENNTFCERWVAKLVAAAVRRRIAHIFLPFLGFVYEILSRICVTGRLIFQA